MNSGIYAQKGKSFANLRVRYDATPSRDRAEAAVEKAAPKHLVAPYDGRLREVLGVGVRPGVSNYASNQALMTKLSEALGEAAVQEWNLNGQRQLHLLTIASPRWLVDEWQPVLNPKQWRSEASRWLRRLKITGIGVMEAAPFMNYPGAGPSRAISFHFHVVGFPHDPVGHGLACKALDRKLSVGNALGLPTVVTRPMIATERDVRHTSEYIGKIASAAKRATPRRDGKGDYVLRNTQLPSQLGLRLAEMFSYFTLTDLIVTHGMTGRLMKNAALRSVGEIAWRRHPSRLSDAMLRALWQRTWEQYREETKSERMKVRAQAYAPVEVIR